MIWALTILWVIWFVPMLLYIIWKRSDWYLFIIPPAVITIIALCISIFSEILGVIAIVSNTFLFNSFIFVKKGLIDMNKNSEFHERDGWYEDY